MEIPVPPGATKINKFRIHGSENSEKVEIRIYRSYLGQSSRDEDIKTSLYQIVFAQSIEGAPFEEMWPKLEIPLDPETDSISLLVRATGRAIIFTVAFEFE